MAAPLSFTAATSAVPDLGFAKAFGRVRVEASAVDRSSSGGRSQTDLSTEQQQQVDELKTIDRRVRAHEAAHINAGDGVVRGGATFTYSSGPDGRKYAIGGEVPIDASPGRTPAQTLAKARAIERAALAPADPSAQDRRVAARAVAMAAEARRELDAGQPETASSRYAAFYQGVEDAGTAGREAVSGGRLLATA